MPIQDLMDTRTFLNPAEKIMQDFSNEINSQLPTQYTTLKIEKAYEEVGLDIVLGYTQDLPKYPTFY